MFHHKMCIAENHKTVHTVCQADLKMIHYIRSFNNQPDMTSTSASTSNSKMLQETVHKLMAHQLEPSTSTAPRHPGQNPDI